MVLDVKPRTLHMQGIVSTTWATSTALTHVNSTSPLTADILGQQITTTY